MLEILGLVLPGITKVLDKLIPDSNARAAAQEQITAALIAQDAVVQAAIAEQAKAQTAINLAEAQHSSMFVAGWRPFVGWVCGLGCAYAFLLKPLLGTAFVAAGWPLPPAIDTAEMIGLLTGMLGFGGLRTIEKFGSVERSTVSK